jgi:flavin-dependent dehydrogenase
MFMTDHNLRDNRSWDERLASAPGTAQRLATWRAIESRVLRAAHSQRLLETVGDGRVAAGDAVATFDPISSLGIGFSLRSGIEAARVAVGSLEGDLGSAEHYAASVDRIYDDYRIRQASMYQMEQRWPRSEFWARRHADCGSSDWESVALGEKTATPEAIRKAIAGLAAS